MHEIFTCLKLLLNQNQIKLRPTVLIKNDTINTHSKICTYVYIMNETSSHSLYDFKLFFQIKCMYF